MKKGFNTLSCIKRKSCSAQLFVSGQNGIIINDLPYNEYFKNIDYLIDRILLPLKLLKLESDKVSLYIRVTGSGISAQADGVAKAIAGYLVKMYPDNKVLLSSNYLLTLDERRVKSKKAGYKKGSKDWQFHKR